MTDMHRANRFMNHRFTTATNTAGMKRYLVFAGSFYYPSGGWHDFVGSSDDLDVAHLLMRGQIGEHGDASGSWGHIVDSVTGQVVAGEECSSRNDPVIPTDPEDLNHS